MRCLKGGEARSNDLEASVGNRRTHPFLLTLRRKTDERKMKKGAREAMFVGTANKDMKGANREELMAVRKFASHRWAIPQGTVGVGGRTGREVEPS